jgi:Lhr-like helicase
LDFIQSGKIRVEKKETRTVSPFAVNLLLRAHSDIIKIEDKMDFIKRVYQELRLKK